MITVVKPDSVESHVKIQIENVFNSADSRLLKIINDLATEIESELDAAAPEKTGTLRFSIKKFRSRKNKYFMWVGPEYTNKHSLNKGDGGNHAHLVEFGTKERYMKKGLFAGGYTRESQGAEKFKGKAIWKPFAGKYTGKMKTNKAFIRPTYDKMGSYILQKLAEAAKLAIKIEAEKQGL